MDHIIFLAQERLQSAQITANSVSSTIGKSAASFKSSVSAKLSNHSTAFHESYLRAWERISTGSFSNRVSILKARFNDALEDLKLGVLYERCLMFLLHEVSRTHVYLCCACFIVGGVTGVIVGSRLRTTIAAPLKMRAVVTNSYAGLESINVVEEIDAPQLCSRNQLLVQVKAAGVDPVDILICKGYGKGYRRHLNRYNPNYSNEFPVILGRDCVGIVVTVGADVTEFTAGDQVWLAVPIHHQGTLSEYVVVSAELAAIVPPNLSLEGAASLPYPIMRAWGVLQQAGVIEGAQGKRCLVHGGVSSVGAVAVQLLKAWGAHVTVTVSSPAHAQLSTLLGAEDVIWEDAVPLQSQLSQREKFDVIINTAGPALHEASLPHCLPQGIVVTSMYPPLPSDKYGVLLGAFCSLYARLRFSFTQSRWCKGEWCGSLSGISGQVLRKVAPLVQNNELQPLVDKAFNCQDAELAFAHIDQVQQVGRTVVRFSNPSSNRRIEEEWPDP